MSTAELLYKQYGPLITLAQLATMLDRSSEGLRLTLRNDSAFSQSVNKARIRLGRRVYFATDRIASIIVPE